MLFFVVFLFFSATFIDCIMYIYVYMYTPTVYLVKKSIFFEVKNTRTLLFLTKQYTKESLYYKLLAMIKLLFF